MIKILNTYAWLGAALILGAYMLLAAGYLDGNSLLYHALVLFGSLGIVLNSFKKKDMQPVVLNIAFMAAAVFAIVRIIT